MLRSTNRYVGSRLELIISRRSIAAAQNLLDSIFLALAQLIGEIHLKSEIKVTKTTSAPSRHSLTRDTPNVVTFCYAIDLDSELVSVQMR